MNCQDLLALQTVVAIRLLLKLFNLVPERVVGDTKDLVRMVLEKLCLVEFKSDIYDPEGKIIWLARGLHML